MLDKIASGWRRARRIRQERAGTHYAPQYAHLPAPYSYMIRHMDGSVFAMHEVEGAAWEDLDEGGLAALHERLCSLHRTLALRSRIVLTKFLCHTEAEEADVPRFIETNELARRIDAGYRRRLIGEGRLWQNRLYVGVMLRPPLTRSNRVEQPENPVDVSMEDVLELEHALGTIEADLSADYGLRRLGLRTEGRIIFSEIAEALSLVLTGRRKLVPLPRGRLGRAICAYRPVFDGAVIEINTPGRTDVSALLGLSVHPVGTDAAMFDHLLAAPYRCTVAQSFGSMPLHEGQTLATRTTNQFVSADDPAKTQLAQLALVKDQLQQREYALGIHNITLAVFADDERALDRAAQIADDDMRASGAIVARIDWDLEAAHFGMLPGTEGLHPRSAPITTRNFAAFGPLHNFPKGWRNGRWCNHVALLTTNGGSAYFWNPHVDSEGQPGESPHIFLTGPNRSGKTTLLLVLIAFAISRAGTRVVLFDKDRGTKLAVLRMGGQYFEFQIGEDSGLAPLRALDGTNPADLDYLARLTRNMIESDGGRVLTEDDDRRIGLGLRIIMAMPPHLRSFGELRAFLGIADGGTADRLRPWCAGNELGWVVDNAVDRISMSGQINGFDQTHYLDHPLACGPIQSYLFHRVAKLADGTPYIVAIDEFWKSLKNAAFRDLVFDGLKTMPKTGGAMWLATQSVADPMSIEGVSHVVREQALTHMHFPNGSAETKDYGVAPNGLGLSERALWWIRVGLLGGGKGRFLLKQGARCVPVQLSLEGDYLEEVRAELSGRTETVRLMDEIIAEMGLDDRDTLFAEFHARRKSPAFQRRLRRTELALVEQPA